MPDIKPIETTYKGYKFRSRLEARWAVFFDSLGVKWEYEKEGYEVKGEWYLPDFWLPDDQFFIEIKGELPSHNYLRILRNLADGSGKAVLLCIGLPSQNPIYLMAQESNESGGGTYDIYAYIWAANFGRIQLVSYDDSRLTRDRDVFGSWDDPGGSKINISYLPTINQSVQEAVSKAKQARFEHGE